MRTLLARIVKPVNPELWQLANPEGRPLGLNDFRRLEASKLESLEGAEKAAALRGLGTSEEMVNKYYAPGSYQSHKRTQRVQHNLEKLESAVAVPSTSDTPPPLPAPRQIAHPSTSITSHISISNRNKTQLPAHAHQLPHRDPAPLCPHLPHHGPAIAPNFRKVSSNQTQIFTCVLG